jgi:GMP synthase-like glutamine amidotransferase
MKIHALQHEPSEGPGEIENWAREHGHSVETHHLYRGDVLPALSSYDMLVVMGGEMNIYQYRLHPWLKPERQLIAATMAAGKRVIGICLGAQLIADAFGFRVTQNPVHEIGWFPVTFTPEARDIFPKLPDSALVLHWHGDTFELPVGATRLAESEACPEQGFMIRDKCLGLQFHMETDAALVRQMVDGSSDFSLWPKGPYVQNPKIIVGEAPVNCAQTRPLLFTMLDTFCGVKN